MNILLVAPLHNQKKYFSAKTEKPFLLSQGQQSWIDALNNLGCNVMVFRSNDSEIFSNEVTSNLQKFLENQIPTVVPRYMNLKNRLFRIMPSNYIKNIKLLRKLKNFSPNIILLSGGVTEVFPETLSLIKKKNGSKVILVEGVNPSYAATKSEREMLKRGLVDLVVENDGGYAKKWKKLGAKKVIVLPMSSVDPKIHRRVSLTQEELGRYSCDVCFVGTLTTERQRFLAGLTDFNLKIWGDLRTGVKLSDELIPFYKGEAHGERMVKIFNAAKIVINIQPKDMEFGGNMRTFEIPGCCAFQIADKINRDWLVPGKEVILFENIRDLRKKLAYYLKNTSKRKQIARAGYDKVHRLHSYEKHFSKLFKEI